MVPAAAGSRTTSSTSPTKTESKAAVILASEKTLFDPAWAPAQIGEATAAVLRSAAAHEGIAVPELLEPWVEYEGVVTVSASRVVLAVYLDRDYAQEVNVIASVHPKRGDGVVQMNGRGKGIPRPLTPDER